jgi:hypothetical protein
MKALTAMNVQQRQTSSQPKPESKNQQTNWIPAFAGMTIGWRREANGSDGSS